MRRNRGYRMKAIVIREFGGPEVLSWEEVLTPTPGPNEVLVRVHAVLVNRTLDLQVRQDGGNYGTVLPLVLGNDPSGVVVAVGQGIVQPLLNQRVAVFGGIRCGACETCRLGQYPQCNRPLMLGVQCWGGYAKYLCMPASNCVPILDGASFAAATLIACHFPLAFGEASLANLKAGDWVLVMGAAGGLGSCRRSPCGGNEPVRGQNRPGSYLGVDVEVMLNAPEFLGEITSTWAYSSHPFSREIVECVARAVRLRILPRTGFASSAEPP
jgi:Zn-dependent alcohol dehydrogenase